MVAHDIFAVQGYERTRTAHIAQRAEVSERLLYKHFVGKRELFLALVEEVADIIAADYQRLIDSDITMADALVSRFEDRASESKPLLFGRSYGPINDPAIDGAVGRAHRKRTDAAAEFIESRIGTGEVSRDVDARVAAWMYGAILREQGILRTSYGVDEARRIGRRAVTDLLEGLSNGVVIRR